MIDFPKKNATGLWRFGTKWPEIARKFVADETDKLTEQLHQQLELDRAQATQTESERYQSRQGEVSSLIESSTMQRIEREIEELGQAQAGLAL